MSTCDMMSACFRAPVSEDGACVLCKLPRKSYNRPKTKSIPNPEYQGPGSSAPCCSKELRDWDGWCTSYGAPGF